MYDDKNILGNQTPNEDSATVPQESANSYEYQPQPSTTPEQVLHQADVTMHTITNETTVQTNPVLNSPEIQQSQQPQQSAK